MKRVVALVAVLLMVLAVAGCDKGNDTSSSGKSGKEDYMKLDYSNGIGTAYPDKEYGFQTEKPAKGEEIAVMHTNMGDISIRFFPEAAPKAVENFKTHAKNHYYDNLTFHRVIADFMIQGGDPKGNGTGGESIWKKPFEDEFDQKLLNISGALSMANSGVNTNGSQFFINYQSKDKAPKKEDYAANTDAAIREQAAESYYQNYDYIKGQCPTLLDFLKLKYAYPVYDWIPAEVWDVYAKNGGSIHLDGAWRYGGGHTVFGQVFEGLDVVEKISKVETDMNDMPVSAVSIKSIEIKTYEG